MKGWIELIVALLLFAEEIMSNSPLIARIGSKELCASQIKDPESIECLFAIDLPTPLVHCIFPQELEAIVILLVSILPLEPMLTGLGIMISIDPPTMLECHMLLEMLKEIETRHCTTGEEVLRHPTIVVLKMIRGSTVAKDVNEKSRFTSIFKPRRDFSKELQIVFHMFEHFDAQDPIERAVREVEDVDVARDDADVLEATRGSDRVDMEFLPLGIGQSCDLRIRIPLRQIEAK